MSAQTIANTKPFAVGNRTLNYGVVPRKTGKSSTIAHRILPNRPKPKHRLPGDASIVMSNRSGEARYS